MTTMNHKNQSEVLLWAFYDRMRPKEIEDIQKNRPIAYLPWWPIAYHSSHNPTGLDSNKSSHMCVDFAKKRGNFESFEVAVREQIDAERERSDDESSRKVTFVVEETRAHRSNRKKPSLRRRRGNWMR